MFLFNIIQNKIIVIVHIPVFSEINKVNPSKKIHFTQFLPKKKSIK